MSETHNPPALTRAQVVEILGHILVGAPCDDANQALSQAMAWVKEGEWQPIETAPKDGTLVLLAWPYWSSSAVVGYWKHSRWVGDAVLEDWFARHEEPGPTAWMPLPPLPAPPSTPEAQS